MPCFFFDAPESKPITPCRMEIKGAQFAPRMHVPTRLSLLAARSRPDRPSNSEVAAVHGGAPAIEDR